MVQVPPGALSGHPATWQPNWQLHTKQPDAADPLTPRSVAPTAIDFFNLRKAGPLQPYTPLTSIELDPCSHRLFRPVGRAGVCLVLGLSATRDFFIG